MSWREVTIRAPLDAIEQIQFNLFEMGVTGVWEEQDSLKVYFPDDSEWPKLELVLRVMIEKWHKPPDQSASIEVAILDDISWATKYQQDYRATRLGSYFFLIPLWDRGKISSHDRFAIYLEPGQAFGTGLHASTQLALRMIERWASSIQNAGDKTAIDVGTGTGILAIALDRLNAKTILGIDNDPVAVEVAQKNIEENDCARIQLSTEELKSIEGQFDLVVSNILLETHLALMGEYDRILKRDGILILSGLLVNQLRETEDAFRRNGFKPLMRMMSQEWLSISLSKDRGGNL